MERQTKNTGWLSWIRIFLIGRKPAFTLIRIVVLVPLVFIVFRFVLLPVRVEGPSMEPTYHDGGVNFINCLAYLRHGPQRKDVVGIRFSGHSIMYMKRVVGLPDDTIQFRRGRLYVNGELLDEPYVILRSRWNSDPVTLGPNEYYVVGDNRSMNIEDHKHGTVDRERIVGKVLL